MTEHVTNTIDYSLIHIKCKYPEIKYLFGILKKLAMNHFLRTSKIKFTFTHGGMCSLGSFQTQLVVNLLLNLEHIGYYSH